MGLRRRKYMKAGGLKMVAHWDEIVAYYNEGHTIVDTAHKFGLGPATIRRWFTVKRIINPRTGRKFGTSGIKPEVAAPATKELDVKAVIASLPRETNIGQLLLDAILTRIETLTNELAEAQARISRMTVDAHAEHEARDRVVAALGEDPHSDARKGE